MSSEESCRIPNHVQTPPVHNMEDLQSELESVSSAFGSPPVVPVTRVESNDDGDGPSTAADPSSFITLMPASSARPMEMPLPRPRPNFPVEQGELVVSPSTVRISSDEQLGMAGLGEMTLRIGVTAASSTPVIERPEPPAKFMTEEEVPDVPESPAVEEEEYTEEPASAEEASPAGRNEKFKCDDCGKVFSYKLSWINHKLTHAGVAPFECHKCGKTFAYGSSAHNHEKIPGRCKGRRPPRRSVAPTAEKNKKNDKDEDEERSKKEPAKDSEQSEEPARGRRSENKMQQAKAKQALETPDHGPEKRSNATKTSPPKAAPSSVKVDTPLVVLPRKRGRPPKNPKPLTLDSALTVVAASSSSAKKSKRVKEKTPPPLEPRNSVDISRSRSQRKIQPPAWMRNMEIDLPVSHGIFQGDSSRPTSTGASWREVNSITNQNRRKSDSSASDSNDEFPELERQDSTSNSALSREEGTENRISSRQRVENGNISENSNNSRRNSNEEQGREGGVFEAATSATEVQAPKKRGRKKKIHLISPGTNTEIVGNSSNAVQDLPEKIAVNPTMNNRTPKTLLFINPTNSVSPTKRSLRGLPHRSEVAAEQTMEEPEMLIPVKKLKIERVDDPEDDSHEDEITLPLEDDEMEEQVDELEQDEEAQGNEGEEMEDEVAEEDESMLEDDQGEEDEGVMDEEEVEEEEEDDDDYDEEVDDDENIGNENSQELEPMNEDENEENQENEEEEEEDTDVFEGSDNEETPPPQENVSHNFVVPVMLAVPSGSNGALVQASSPEYDLKSAAINFLNKKISNRNMQRIRRELMELSERGDFFQFTQWAPLASGLLQAMLLRNFS